MIPPERYIAEKGAETLIDALGEERILARLLEKKSPEEILAALQRLKDKK
ncbi:MAG: hypothetical protein K2W96_19285 [Gemmataceae bacterium]|nr:hypothetical protein [Gemmataceae bacterium]